MRKTVRVVCLALILGACTSGGGTSQAGSSGSRTTAVVSSTVPYAPTTRPARPAYVFTGISQRDGITRIETGAFALEISSSPFRITALDEDGVVATDATSPSGGLFVEREGVRHFVESGVLVDPTIDALAGTGTPGLLHTSEVDFEVAFDDGSTAGVQIAGHSQRTLSIEIDPSDSDRSDHDPTGSDSPAKWGVVFQLAPDELIYGLDEGQVGQTASDVSATRRPGAPVTPLTPAPPPATLNRRGEIIPMVVDAHVAGRVPFHQSSKGYGILVDGTMPGTYDIGATDAAALSMEFEIDPTVGTGSYSFFYGPGHAEILNEFATEVGMPGLLSGDSLLPWISYRDLPKWEAPAGVPEHDMEMDPEEGHGPTEQFDALIHPLIAADLDAYVRYGLRNGGINFVDPFDESAPASGEPLLRFDPSQYPRFADVLIRLDHLGWEHQVAISPQASGYLADFARAEKYVVPGDSTLIDFTNPNARKWFVTELTEFLATEPGRRLDGVIIIGGDNAPGSALDHYSDGRNGRVLHNAYPVIVQEAIWEAIDRSDLSNQDGWLAAQSGYTGSSASARRWFRGPLRESAADLVPSTDSDLRRAIVGMGRASFLGNSYWGSEIGGDGGWADREVYARWLQVGALSPLMGFSPEALPPWRADPSVDPSADDDGVDEELVAIYSRYVHLRSRLTDYLLGTAGETQRTGLPIARPLVFDFPNEAGAIDRWDEWMLGDDLLVAPVWQSGGRSREVWIPPGTWINFWNHDETVKGPATITVDVPLEVIPLYVREGSDLLELDPDS